jgi:hypothetical protein
MKIYLLVITKILITCNFCYAFDLLKIISNGSNGSYTLNKAVEFSPLVRKTSGSGKESFDHQRFLINNIRIKTKQQAQIFYEKYDIMPTCFFTHVPSYPKVDIILKSSSINYLRGIIGRETKVGDQVSVWCFFRIHPPLISLIHISASHTNDGVIKGISVFEATKSLNDFNGINSHYEAEP